MVDVADYIAFIRLEHFACLSDLVDSAAELFFMPGTLRLGHGGEAHVDWSGSRASCSTSSSGRPASPSISS